DGSEPLPQEPDEIDQSADPTFDDGVQHASIVGDYKGAVAQCISANKMADALVIAHFGGASLWESTRDQYFRISRSPYLKVVSAMVNNDLLSIVNTRPLKSWKETLALLCSFAQREEWTTLCGILASKLMAAGNTLAATLCYICAGNIDKTLEIWSRSLQTEHDGKSYVDLVQDLMEKTIVLALATGQKRFSASLCKLVEKYAEILRSQGLLTAALECLKLLGSDELPPELVILRDHIAFSAEPVHQKPVIATLTRLSNEKSKLGGSRANPANKRKIEVNSRKSGASFAKLNSGDLASRARQGINQKSMLLLPPSRMSKQPLRLRTARKKLEFFDMKSGGITGMAFF
ncbi:protein transport protein SEC31 homolog B-like, partial [Alnus glutinosa]|uniref:protein transport protein SEC31 homolog B-like n=1 Tax=Alnus glutinosa TaxID=3517 RepID=UPI002D78CCFB